MLRRVHLFFFALAVPILSWSGWYLFTYHKAWQEAVATRASTALTCERNALNIGPRVQPEESGPTEIVVSGCGKRVKLSCQDQAPLTKVFYQPLIHCEVE